MLKTRFCELFGVELPIMLAGMGSSRSPTSPPQSRGRRDGHGGAGRFYARGNP